MSEILLELADWFRLDKTTLLETSATMDSEDIVMMDVDESTTSMKSNWVKPPDSPQDLLTTWTAETSTSQNLVQYLSRWPPSRTPAIYGPWICVKRDGQQPTTTPPDFKGLSDSFQALALSGTVTTESLDQISKSHNVITGKWMIFEESNKIDMIWGKLIHHLCVERQKGSAKVSTWKKGERHVICVYVDDYTDLEEVNGLRIALRDIGVKRRIGFKPDAYTHLGIYKENAWKIRPSRYLEWILGLWVNYWITLSFDNQFFFLLSSLLYKKLKHYRPVYHSFFFFDLFWSKMIWAALTRFGTPH